MAGEIDEEYNRKIQRLGSWINESFLEELLSNKLKEEVTVESYNVAAAVADGENYLSTLYRTQVTYIRKESAERDIQHIMIKGLPESLVTAGILQRNSTFKKECYFYMSVLPAMRRLIEEYFPPGTLSIAPEEFFTSRPDTLVMEDISHDGYRMKSRHDQLDMKHCLLTLQAMARLHALSYKLHEEDPGLLDGACSHLYIDRSRSYLCIFTDDGLRALADELENWPEYVDAVQIAGKLRRVLPFLWEKVQALEQATGRFCVFNHGDMWMNNVMFQYDENGDVHSAKLVDFQLSRYTSPAMDLYYFLGSSAQAEVLEDHLLELIDKYHEALISDLATLGISTDYTVMQLHEDMRDYAVYGVSVISSITAIVLAPVREGVGEEEGEFLDNLGDSQHPFVTTFRTELYKKFAMSVYRLFDRVGYLEDAATRLQHIVDEMLEKEKEENSDDKIDYEERVISAHDRPILARLKSSVRGVFRKFMDLSL